MPANQYISTKRNNPMKSDGSKNLKSQASGYYGATIGSSKPPVSKFPLLPKNMNKPFWQRLKEWWT